MGAETRRALANRIAQVGRGQIPWSRRVGMGCAYLGGPADAARLIECQTTLDAAYEAGFRHFDTAELYGASEFRLGEFVRRIDRETVVLSSKSRLPDYLAPREAAQHMRQNLRNSLERLGTERLDIYLVHDVSSLETTLAPGGPMELLVEERRKGTIQSIGIGVRSHTLLRQAASHPEFDAILTYLDFNLADRSATGVIEHAAAQGVAVLNATPLSNGLLTGADPSRLREVHPDMAPRLPAAQKIFEFARREGVSVLALALQFPARHPGVTLTLTGPSNADELASSAAALKEEIPGDVWQRLGVCLAT